MLTAKEAAQKLLIGSKNLRVLAAFDNGNTYMFSLGPANTDEVVYGSFFLVDKRTGKIKPYAYLNDLDNFKKMLKSGGIKI